MNIEEKAMEVLKHCKDRNFSAFDKIYFDDETNMCVYQAIETLLTAYEKEKEKNFKRSDMYFLLKSENTKLKDEVKALENADLTTVYLNGVYDGEKKAKDKIKAKIEEYDDKGMTVNLANRSAGKTFQQAVHYEVKKVLQSLLEKE